MSATTEQLEQGLEQDRQQLRETLSAIEDKMTPGQLLDEAMNRFGVAPKAFASTLGTQVKDNPMAAVLVGVGLTWMMTGSRSASAQRPATPAPDAGFDDADYEALMAYDRLHSTEIACLRRDDETMEAYAQRLHQERARALQLEPTADEDHHSFGSRVSGAADAIKHKSAEARDRMRRAAQSTKQGVGSAMSAGMDGARGAAGAVKAGMGSAAGSVQTLHQTSPFATASIGVAIGAVLGALTPLTRQEEKALAPLADKGLQLGSEGARRAADALTDKIAPAPAPAGEMTTGTTALI